MLVRLLLLIALLSYTALIAKSLPFYTLPCVTAENTHILTFKTIGGLPIVQASIDGIQGNFILDLGSADIILNERYFKASHRSNYPPISITNPVVAAGELKIGALHWQELQEENIWAYVVDLSHLETTKGIPIHGLLGQKIVQDYEVVLDYVRGTILLCKLDQEGNKFCTPYEELPTSSLDVSFAKHLACVTAYVGNTKLRLALDSGAEINILDSRLRKKLLPYLEASKNYHIRGLSSDLQQVEYTKVRNLWIANKDYPRMRTVLSDLTVLRMDIDGILGYEFFVRCQKVAINFKQRKLHIWHLPDPDAPAPASIQPVANAAQRVILP